jgi:uncharacterized metal-binding protein
MEHAMVNHNKGDKRDSHISPDTKIERVPNKTGKVLVIPCSGIGKVQGLISRESVYRVVDDLSPLGSETVCLALLVSGDPETVKKVRDGACITIDGCPKLCAQKNVEMSGGKVSHAVRVFDALKNHRGKQFGAPTALSEDGWTAVDEIAAGVAGAVRQMAIEEG